MKIFLKHFVAAGIMACTLIGFATQVAANDPAAESNDNPTTATGVSGSFLFTDELGNRRLPTEEEATAMGLLFQKDMDRLVGKNRGNVKQIKHPHGGVSSTIALKQLEYLMVRQNADGTISYGHAGMDEHGIVQQPTVNTLPEK
jgi:hypothetical protein